MPGKEGTSGFILYCCLVVFSLAFILDWEKPHWLCESFMLTLLWNWIWLEHCKILWIVTLNFLTDQSRKTELSTKLTGMDTTAFGVSLIKDRWPKKVQLPNHFVRNEHVVQFLATTTECFDCTTTSKFHFQKIDCFNKASWKKKSSNVALKLDDWYEIVRMEAAWNTFTPNYYSFHLHVCICESWVLACLIFLTPKNGQR